MERLVKSSRNKEIYTQAELYRMLRNVCIHPNQQQPILGSTITSVWEPHDILIEPTVLSDGSKNKEADLVLLGRKKQHPLVIEPLLVIEVKRRKLTRLTQSYQSHLQQSYNYAKALDCTCYAVYDGNTWLLMQMAEPYLIAFFKKRLGIDHKGDITFSEKLWNIAGHLRDQYRRKPIGEFAYHDDYEPWKKSIYYFLRDAYQRNANASGGTPSEEQLNEKASQLVKLWHDLHKDYLISS